MEDGRGPSIWDTFSHQPGNIQDSSSGDVAIDEYHRYQEDIDLMVDLGVDAYRFSISWSRILPNGSGSINQEGLNYYNKLIDALVQKGIQPYVTLYHWDLPQALQDSYKGWLSSKIIEDYANYADICFSTFGDRVKHWLTFNEPHGFSISGYDLGMEAPGRCSISIPIVNHGVCKFGNSSTEPYIVAHNVLLSHAAAVQTYRTKYTKTQGGSIGIAFDVFWYEPLSNSSSDIEAAQIAQDFQLGWFMDPIYFGDYPASMRERVGHRLPIFNKTQSAMVKGSLDFVGVNHYSSFYAANISLVRLFLPSGTTDTFIDAGVIPFPWKGTQPIGEPGPTIWQYVVPWGIRKLMNYIKQRYSDPLIIITENGTAEQDDPLSPMSAKLDDEKRIEYHRDYMSNLSAAITEDGCNVQGYFVWSLIDNWEWISGFTMRFGVYFVDYNDNLTRYPKASVNWFKQLLQR
ncbi:beta-glucosidase 6-like [Cryptomeria japonica]|uniref:beta-glucosidase 6-like n=1 Tax=Cryptomeria japonica TaxID=3369 RepID=UPI0027DA62A1|nr:beta-glucosidase 6-like [Cryptomeria japonica]